MKKQKNNLIWLQMWYQAQTNGNWEHQHGIKIVTTDNPGWRVDIDLGETDALKKHFDRAEIERSHLDWIHCWVDKGQFKIACGPQNLNEGLEIFRNWITKSNY